jgi:hemolysin activation/secretion protein
MITLQSSLAISKLLRLRTIPCVTASLLLGFPLAGMTQQAATGPSPVPIQASAPSPVFRISGFNVTGENPLPEGETSKVLAPFLRADASLDTLQKATTALEAALRVKGFALHRVALPPQELGTTVTLNIVKFVIGKVTVEGLAHYTEANIRASLPELTEGTAPNFKTLSVQTAIANESQGKQVQVGLKEAEEADQIDAKVVVKESKPWNFATSLANVGTSTTGNDRLTFAGGHANVFGLDHQFTGAYTTSIERPSDVRQIGLNYRVPMYRWGGVLGASYTRSDVVGNNGSFTNNGAGQTLGLNYNHYLPPDGGYRSYLTAGLDDKLFYAPTITAGGVTTATGPELRSRSMSIGYNARVESDTSVWGYSTDLVFSVASSDGNLPGTTTSNWRALRASGNYLTSFGGGWLWSARGQLQFSPDVLISGEQLGFGGSSTIRGAREDQRITGDTGLFASTEISTRELAPGLRLLGFLDAGWKTSNGTNVTRVSPGSDSMSSVGLGLRFASPSGIVVSADYGRVVGGSAVSLTDNPNSAQSGNEKIHVNLSFRF